MQETSGNVKIVDTDTNARDGQNKCPKCGATDISLNMNNGKLRCNFCRYEFDPENVDGFEKDVSKLEGEVLSSGSKNIDNSADDMITLKCQSCGAEVVIDTTSSQQARCHWCRNILSINHQIPNGSVPDVVLPFSVKKEDAKLAIEQFVGKRKFFAHPKFKKEFTTDNIMGVYFPYMLIDVNSHVYLEGDGEHLIRTYTVGSGDSRKTYYDADLYHVKRDFDIAINGLTIESSKDKLNQTSKEKTTNIINAIMPFDIENIVKWNANYIKGFTSEKRDVNVDELKPLMELQAKDVARFKANETLTNYDRGVCWKTEKMDVKGQQWKSAYLPVWLYSYQQVKGDRKLLHYVAVNARTKETMGSVPIHMPVLIGVSILVEIPGVILTLFVDSDYRYIFLLSGIIYFIVMYARYRNSGARHMHEKDTKSSVSNLKQEDVFIKRRNGLSNARIEGVNNTSVTGAKVGSKVLNNVLDASGVGDIVNSFNNKK